MNDTHHVYLGHRPYPEAVIVHRTAVDAGTEYVPKRVANEVEDHDYGGAIILCDECGAPQPDDYSPSFCWACGARFVRRYIRMKRRAGGGGK